MSLLSYDDLRGLQDAGIIQNSLPEHVNAASIDVTLGATILTEVLSHGLVSLSKHEPLPTQSVALGYYDLWPGEFVLAQSEQVFNLPDDLSCEYKLKSSMARIGLNHLTAGWCDAGWNGSALTLELVNVTQHHAIRVTCGDRIGQVVFFRHALVPPSASYRVRGRYNGDLIVKGAKP